MINPDDFEIEELSDGSLSLTCGRDGMDSDLVFSSSSGHTKGKQREILEYIVSAIKPEVST